MKLNNTIRNAIATIALGATLGNTAYAAAKPNAKESKPTAVSQTARPNSPAALTVTPQPTYIPRVIDSEKNTYNAAVYGTFQRALEMGLSEKDAIIQVKSNHKISQKRAQEFLKRFYALPEETTATAKAADVSKTAKPKVPMNIALFGEALARFGYHSINEGSKTTQGTSVLDMTSQGSLMNTEFRGKLGVNHDNKNYVFVPVEVAWKLPDMTNAVAGVGTVGGVNGSSLDLGFGLGYGRNIANHRVMLSVLMDMYQESLKGKHDIVTFTQDNTASNIAAVVEYALNTEKGRKVFEARYTQNVAKLSGESKTTVSIPSLGMTLPTQTGDLTRGGMSLEGTVYLALPLEPFVTGKLETVFEEVKTPGNTDTKNYTKLGAELGATAYRKGDFSLDAAVGYGAITSGLVNESELRHGDIYGRLGAQWAFGRTVDFKPTTITAAVDATSNTMGAYSGMTATAVVDAKANTYNAASKPKQAPKQNKQTPQKKPAKK